MFALIVSGNMLIWKLEWQPAQAIEDPVSCKTSFVRDTLEWSVIAVVISCFISDILP